jgi:hypothetical protein
MAALRPTWVSFQDRKVSELGKGRRGQTRWPPVLAQRAASEGPRWTRAVEAQSAPIPEEITSELGGTLYRWTRAVESNLGHSLSSSQLKSPACGQIFPGRAPSFLFTLLEYSASSDSGQPLLFDCHTTACCTNCGYDFWSYHRNIRCRPGFRIS